MRPELAGYFRDVRVSYWTSRSRMLDWRETRFSSLTLYGADLTTTVDLAVSSGSLVVSILREKQPRFLHVMFFCSVTQLCKLLRGNRALLASAVFDWIYVTLYGRVPKSWQPSIQHMCFGIPDKVQFFPKTFDDSQGWFLESFARLVSDRKWYERSKDSNMSGIFLITHPQAR